MISLQIIKLIQSKSSLGLSATYLLLGHLSSDSTLLNAIVFYARRFQCCSTVSLYKCLQLNMSFITIAIQWCCFTVILCLYPAYYPKIERNELLTGKKSKEFKFSLLIVLICTLYLMFNGLLLAVIVSKNKEENGLLAPKVLIFAKIFGYISALLTCFMYVPQLWRTWKTQVIYI